MAHSALIVWALVGGFFLRADDPLPVQSTQVSLLTGQEFAALSLPPESPLVFSDPPTVDAQPQQDSVPEVSSNPDITPDQPAVAQVAEPALQDSPIEPEIELTVQTNVSEDVPDAPEAPAQDAGAEIAPATDEPPTPAPSPRIAETPAPETLPDTEISETATPEVVPDDAAEIAAEEKPATAPKEAASEIVTEAEKPSPAPLASTRPRTRPKQTLVAQATPAPQETQNDAISDAVAQAVAQPEQPAQPSGPPLTSGEKDLLRVAVSACWNVGSSSSEALSTTVVVAVRMSISGKPESISLLSSNGKSDNATKIAFDAARRAILRCQKTGYNLPSDKYSQWQDIEMTFNPEEMRTK